MEPLVPAATHMAVVGQLTLDSCWPALMVWLDQFAPPFEVLMAVP
jgi:hypothetical protein